MIKIRDMLSDLRGKEEWIELTAPYVESVIHLFTWHYDVVQSNPNLRATNPEIFTIIDLLRAGF